MPFHLSHRRESVSEPEREAKSIVIGLALLSPHTFPIHTYLLF